MKMQCGRDKAQAGVALVVVLVLTIAFLTAGMVMIDRVAFTVRESSQLFKERQAFQLADAAKNKALWWFNTQYKQPTGTILTTTSAPVTYSGSPLSFPGNHPNAYTACMDGTAMSNVGTSFTTNLVNQDLNDGTYTVDSARLLTARVNCFGVTTPRDRDEMWEVRVTGTYQGTSKTVTAFFLRQFSALWDFGLFAKNKIKLDSNVETKSFDSSAGTWSFSPSPGSWSNTCSCSSNIGTNSSTNAVVTASSNVTINGNATPGPGAGPGAVVLQGNSTVTGSIAPASNLKTLDDPSTPFSCTSNCNHTFTSGNNSLAPGSYGTVIVDSNATLTFSPGSYSFTNLEFRSNTQLLLSGTTGTVAVTVTNTFLVDANATANSGGNPARLEVNVTANTTSNTQDADSSNSSALIRSNGGFFGTIYAPNAKVLLDSNARVYGAVIADRVTANSNAKMFYDRNLINKDAGGNGDMVVPYFYTNL